MRELKVEEKILIVEALEWFKAKHVRAANAAKIPQVKQLLTEEAARCDNLAVVFR
jgi:hypothetical protein